MKHTLSVKFMWPELSTPDRIRAAARHRFDGVELWDWRGEDLDACVEAVRETGIELTAFFGHSHGGLADPSQIDVLEGALSESIMVAQRVGADQLFMFSDELSPDGEMTSKPPSLIKSRRTRAMVEGLRRCAGVVTGTGITLVVEAVNSISVPGYFLCDTGDAIDLIREVNDPAVRLVIDCFHHHMSGGRLVEHIVEGLPYLAAVHISDVPDRRPPGQGEIEFGAVRRALNEHGYDGRLTFEVKPVDGDSEGAVAAIKAAFPF